MLFRFFSFVKFLLKSTNEHGVHSPFIFDFVTRGLYKKKIKIIAFDEDHQLKELSPKKQLVLSKIINYFNINTIEFDASKFELNKENNYKTLFVNDLTSMRKLNLSNLTAKHIILFDNLHRNKKSYQNWKSIIQNKNVTVSIDLYYFGVLFFRTKQAKEHFTIRV